MPKVKSAAEAAAKYSRVAPSRQQDYEAGVKNPSTSWQAATAASVSAYESGLQDSIQRGAFQRGVQEAGDEKWSRKTAGEGAARWAPGVRAAAGDYERGMQPVVETIERTVLPPRAPRGDPRNFERMAVLARALTERRRRG
jgi:hypothetical protein